MNRSVNFVSSAFGFFKKTSMMIQLTDIHGARPADALPAGPPEGQGRVHLVLDLDQSVEDHGATVV